MLKPLIHEGIVAKLPSYLRVVFYIYVITNLLTLILGLISNYCFDVCEFVFIYSNSPIAGLLEPSLQFIFILKNSIMHLVFLLRLLSL